MRISDWSSDVCSSDLCRYAPAFARIESCHEPEAMEEWPVTGGAEAMVRLPDGRFLVFSEFAYGPKNSKQLMLFNHDPAEPGPPPALLRSEEHTSELQSLQRISYPVFGLKKQKKKT